MSLRHNSYTETPFAGDWKQSALYNSQGKSKFKSSLSAINKFLILLGLGFLSWLTTYTGLVGLITANSGQLDFSYSVAIGFAVAMLMLMIIYLLDALFSPLRWWLRILYVAGYVFLTLISVGFGFGFYWKFLEAKAEAGRSAKTAVSQVQISLQSAQSRLVQLQNTLDALTLLSARKAEQERSVGRTCPKSPPGDGPRRRLRDDDAHKFHFAAQFVRGRADDITHDIRKLDAHMLDISKKKFLPQTKPDQTQKKLAQENTSNYYLHNLNQQLNLTLTRFNAFRTDPQLLQFRDGFAERAKQSYFDNGYGGRFFCPDGQLKAALLGVVRAIDGLPKLQKSDILAVEGSEAVIEAFRRLIVSAGGLLTLQPAPSAEDLRQLQHKRSVHVANKDDSQSLTDLQSPLRAGLGQRDYIPLFIALFVDLCILLVSINRPVSRLHSFVNFANKGHDAHVHEVLSHFYTVHTSEESNHLDIFHNVMFDIGSKQYIAVPVDLRFASGQDKRLEAEADICQRNLRQIRYLTTLMITLEDTGLVRRASYISAKKARRYLHKLQSPFAEAPGFRVYYFKKGAWPAIILDHIVGEAKRLEAEKQLLPPPLPVLPLKTVPQPLITSSLPEMEPIAAQTQHELDTKVAASVSEAIDIEAEKDHEPVAQGPQIDQEITRDAAVTPDHKPAQDKVSQKPDTGVDHYGDVKAFPLAPITSDMSQTIPYHVTSVSFRRDVKAQSYGPSHNIHHSSYKKSTSKKSTDQNDDRFNETLVSALSESLNKPIYKTDKQAEEKLSQLEEKVASVEFCLTDITPQSAEKIAGPGGQKHNFDLSETDSSTDTHNHHSVHINDIRQKTSTSICTNHNHNTHDESLEIDIEKIAQNFAYKFESSDKQGK